jgi:hypothetical protein
VITPWGAGGFSTLAEQAPGLVAAAFGVYVSLIVILAIVGAMHPDEKIRADTQRVLDRLLGRGEERAGS